MRSPRAFRRACSVSRLAWIALLSLQLASCDPSGQPAESARPDLLLITIDTLRADHLGVYGYARATSPAIDRLASEGVTVEVAYAPTGATCPSHATLFTSRHPYVHGVLRNGLTLVEEETTLAEMLQDAGYRTAAFISSFPVSHRFGFAQGFDHFDDRFDPKEETVDHERWGRTKVEGGFDRRAGGTARALAQWLEQEQDPRPLFLWVHLFDPHSPYDPPARYARRFRAPSRSNVGRTIARYDEEILYADSLTGEIVDGVERSRPDRELLVVLTSDHGEGLMDHGWQAHARFTYEEELRVPLIFRWKGRLPAGRRVLQPAHLIDVVPTLAALLDMRIDGAVVQGIDLSPHLFGDAEPDRNRPIFLQRPYFPRGRPLVHPDEKGWGLGLRRGHWKYFEAKEENRRELYDVEHDPREKRNLASKRTEKADELSALLATWRERQTAMAVQRNLSIPPDARAGLEALGYLGSGEREPDVTPRMGAE